MLKTRALKTSTVGTTTTRITVDKLPPAVLILPSSFDVIEVNLAVDQFPTGITSDLSVIVGAEPVVQSKIPEEVDVTEEDLLPVEPVEPELVAAAIESLGKWDFDIRPAIVIFSKFFNHMKELVEYVTKIGFWGPQT